MEILIMLLVVLVMAILLGIVLSREQSMVSGQPGSGEIPTWQPDAVILRRLRRLLAEGGVALTEDEIMHLARRSPSNYLEHLSMRELVVWFRHQVEDMGNGLG